MIEAGADDLMAELATVYLENLNRPVQVALFNLTRAVAGLSAEEKRVVLIGLNFLADRYNAVVRADVVGPSIAFLSSVSALVEVIHEPATPANEEEPI